MKNLLLALTLITFPTIFSGCFLLKPPSVENRTTGPSASVYSLPTPFSVGVADLSDGDPTTSGLVAVDLKQQGADDRWVYWTAGTSSVTYRPSPEFQGSSAWDLRLTKYFPLVGSNGGKTAEDEGSPDGRAAFAVIPDGWGAGFIPRRVSQIETLPFVADAYESLEFEGVKLAPEYQNRLLNEIGPGLLKSYSMKDHGVELSQRIFILRTADGASYYALRFYYYSRNASLLVFQWKKLQ